VSPSHKAHSMVLNVVRQADPQEDLRRQRVFAWAVVALIYCASPLLSRWLTIVAGPAKATSKLRRLQRWLCNPLIDVAAYYRPFIQAAMVGWAGSDILLAVDGTSPNGACVVCRVAVCFRGRAFPLCWMTFDTRSHSISYARYVAVLELARTLLPDDCKVTLLGDRGFGHRQLMKWCRRVGWHFLLRVKSDSIVILPDGSRRRLDAWQPHRQDLLHLADVRLLGAGGERIGPLHVHIALAPEPATEAWYLASDSPHGCAALAGYRCRYNIEHSIRDDKSGGWNWELSPLTDPIQADRLCLIMAVATLYVVTEGTFVSDRGHRLELDPHDTRGLSYFQIGLRSIQRLISQGRRLPLRLFLDPRPDPDPVTAYGIPFRLFGTFTWLPATRPAGC
jgi:Transposase DDE domain